MSYWQRTRANLALYFSQVIAYAIICINIRAVAEADYFVAVASDVTFAFLNFYAITKIAKCDGTLDAAIAYATGSAVGTVIGINISKAL